MLIGREKKGEITSKTLMEHFICRACKKNKKPTTSCERSTKKAKLLKDDANLFLNYCKTALARMQCVRERECTYT